MFTGPDGRAIQEDEDEDQKPPVPKRTTSRTASAQQLLQAIKQQQKTTTITTSITHTTTTIQLPSTTTLTTASTIIQHQQQPTQSKQIVGICHTTGLGILNNSGTASSLIQLSVNGVLISLIRIHFVQTCNDFVLCRPAGHSVRCRTIATTPIPHCPHSCSTV